jgi:hypothetical protein
LLVSIKNGELHVMTVGQGMGDLESPVEILARSVDCGVVVPVEEKEIDPKCVCPGELLLDRTRSVVLPARQWLAILVRTVDQAVEVKIGE